MDYSSASDFPQWMQKTLSEGFAALQNNNTDLALACCKKLIQAKADFPQAHFLVGLIALQLRDRKTAIHAFGSVTTLDNGHGPAWAHLANELLDTGQINRADSALENAVKCETNNHNVNHLVGNLLTKFGDQKNAEKWQARACSLKPRELRYDVNHANSLLYLGEDDRLKKKLKSIFEYAPDNAQSHFIMATSRRAEDDLHIKELTGLIANKDHSAVENVFLHYALGKELEDQQQWSDAFDAFSQGAAAKRRFVKYDEQAQADAHAALASTFTSDWLSEQQLGCQDDSPIFVVGQPRTGTTLIERIISSHSQVDSAGELQQLPMALRRLLNYTEPNWFSADFFSKAAKLDSKSIGEMYLHTAKRMHGDSPRFVDKMPPNFHYIPVILSALPRAKIVHVTRNPMDACFASFKQLFADAYTHSYEQREMARHHIRYLRLMSLWRNRFPHRFLDIAYEDVVSDIEPQARRLIEYLDLDWQDACLNFHSRRSAVATASTVQVREPAHTRSVGRWKKYQDQLAPMIEEFDHAGIEISR